MRSLPSKGEAPWSHVERGAAFTLQFSATTAGTRRWFEARGQPSAPGATAGAVIVIRDISVHKGLEQALHHQALHDPLTGVPNRSLFHDRLAGAVRAAARAGSAGRAAPGRRSLQGDQ